MSAKENVLPMKQPPADEAVFRQMQELVNKANKANPESKEVRELRRLLDRYPDLWEGCEYIAASVRGAVIRKIVSVEGNAEMLKREYQEKRDSLGWKEADGMERLLIERAMLCWLRLLWAENYNAALTGPGHSLRECEYADRALTLAHNRFLRACEALGRVRRLAGKVERPKKPMNALEAVRLLEKMTGK